MQEVTIVLGYPKCRKADLVSSDSKEIGVPLIESGKLIKQYTEERKDEGIKQQMQNGELVPNQLIKQLVANKVREHKSFMLVGYPRNKSQMQDLESLGYKVKQIINIRLNQTINLNDYLTKKEQEKEDSNANDIANIVNNRIEQYNSQQQFVFEESQKNKVVQIMNREQFAQTMNKNICFVMGPPCAGKTQLSLELQKRTGYKVINLKELQKNSDWMNMIIQEVKNSNNQNVIFDGFFNSVYDYHIYKDYCVQPLRVFGLDRSKDYLYNEINAQEQLTEKDRRQIRKQFDQYMNSRQELQNELKQQGLFQSLESGKEMEQALQYFNPEIYLAWNIENKLEKYNEFAQKVFQKHNIIEIDLKRVPSIDELKKVIFKNNINNKFMLKGVNQGIKLQEIEEHFNRVKYLLDFEKQKVKDDGEHIQVEFKQRGSNICLDLEKEVDKNIQIMECHILKRNMFGIVVGAQGIGKTSVSKQLSDKLAMNYIDWENYQNQLKEKLGGEDGPLEELSYEQILNSFRTEFQKNQQFVFDGWMFSDEQLKQFIDLYGAPSWSIYLKADQIELQNAYRRKKEMEGDAELGEDDLATIEQNVQQQQGLQQILEECCQNNFNSCLYNVLVQGGVQTLLTNVNSIFMKRIISLAFQNQKISEAQKNVLKNMSYNNDIQMVDVQGLLDEVVSRNECDELRTKLMDEYMMIQSGLEVNRIEQYSQSIVLEMIKQHLNRMVVSQRDVLLVGYPRSQCQFQPNDQIYPRALDEIINVEQQLGVIYKLCIQADQQLQSEYNDPIQEPVDEPVVVKKTEPDEDEKQEQNEDDEEAKPKFQPNKYAWTVHDGMPKNMVQIFTKLKKVECQVQSDYVQVLAKMMAQFQVDPQVEIVTCVLHQ